MNIILAIFDIAIILLSLLWWIIVIQFILSLLITFNVVNMSNDFVAAIWRAVNALLEPMLKPVRRFMPDTGMIDLSPMVLIIGLTILQIILRNLAVTTIA